MWMIVFFCEWKPKIFVTFLYLLLFHQRNLKSFFYYTVTGLVIYIFLYWHVFIYIFITLNPNVHQHFYILDLSWSISCWLEWNDFMASREMIINVPAKIGDSNSDNVYNLILRHWYQKWKKHAIGKVIGHTYTILPINQAKCFMCLISQQA